MMTKNKYKFMEVKEINQLLLKNLSECLKMMEVNKCPYFHLEGIGGVFMDESYADRNNITLSKNDKAIAKRLTESFHNADNEIFKQINIKFEDLKKEIQQYTKSIIQNQNPSTKQNENVENEDPYKNIEENISNMDDATEPVMENVEDVDEMDGGEPSSEPPTTEEAVETVRRGSGRKYYSAEQRAMIRKQYAIRNKENKKTITDQEDDV